MMNEIERLKDLTTYQKKTIDELNERYEKAVDDLSELADASIKAIKIERLKTITRVAEMLKLKGKEMFGRKVVYEIDIDDLVQEMFRKELGKEDEGK